MNRRVIAARAGVAHASVGAEVGFHRGRGRLGSAALLSLTPLAPAQVAGTDIASGLSLAHRSGAHWFSHTSKQRAALQLIAGGRVGAITGTLLERACSAFGRCVCATVGGLLILAGISLHSYTAWARQRAACAGAYALVK